MIVGHVATASQLRDARRRIDRFVMEHGDELLRLSRERQTEILEDVHQGRGKMARAKLRLSIREKTKQRETASKKAAQTRFEKRRKFVADRISREMPNAHRGRVLRNARLLIADDVNRLHDMDTADFRFYVKNAAREASATGAVASAFFYR